jgi:PhzF family phenazine biosynthesis protein
VRARVFAPAVGVPEDPATGSAAGPLAVHLVATGAVAAGLVEVHQGHEVERPSLIEVTVAPGAPPRVGGGCVAVARGTFEL